MNLDNLSDAINAVAPDLSEDNYHLWINTLGPPMQSSGIWSPRRVAAFIGQAAYESMAFTHMEEDLSYREETISRVFPTHFQGIDPAPFAHNPTALGNHVYANRMGNGDEASGDGYRFRGGGIFELTGKTNYQLFATSVKKTLDEVVPWVRTAEGAAASACWYWTRNSLNSYADPWNLEALTRHINGGLNGYDQRQKLCGDALDALTAPT